MQTASVRRPVDGKKVRGRGVRPVIEGLEDRLLLYAVTGDHFKYGSRITWSIVPDGANLGGATSNLVSSLNQDVGQGNWIAAIEQAFATWESVANINLVQVSDDGEVSNAGAYQQGNLNFGDIRIGGYAQAQNILAYTLLPPPANGGSDSGDIFFNTSQPWNVNNNIDLQAVAMHEVGLALGMAETDNSQVVMYGYYAGIKQTLTTDDINGIQSIWAPRAEDSWYQGNLNSRSNHAGNITPFNNAYNQVVLTNMDVATPGETYWFKVTTPANASNNLTVVAQSANLSELSPWVQLYNANLQGIVQAAAPTNAFGTFTGVTISNATPNTTYYIRVSGSNGGPTGDGAYALFVNMGTGALAPVAPPNTQVATAPDQGGGGAYQQVVGPVGTSGLLPTLLPDGFKLADPGQVAASAKLPVGAVALPITTATTTAGQELIPNPVAVTVAVTVTVVTPAAGNAARPAATALDLKQSPRRINVPHPAAPSLGLVTRPGKGTLIADKVAG